MFGTLPRFRNCSLVSPLLALALLGCTNSGEDSGDETGSFDLDLDACPGGTLVGILDSRDASCDLGGTVPEGWFSERLFSDGPMPDDSVPGELARYCKFKRDFDSGGYSLEQYERMLGAIDAAPMMDVDTVALNCAVQQPQTGLAESAEVQAAAREAFRVNIGRVDAEALAASAPARVLVDYALLDTVPNPPGGEPPIVINEHGLQMAEIATDILCPGGEQGCLDRVGQVLAMPRETAESAPTWATGGTYGAQTDIGLAIVAAVKDWARELDKPDGAQRLVLNLSLGWETTSIDTLDPERGPVAAVRTALQFAACHGALVFVAAGNNRAPECPTDHTGLLYPAAFETMLAPDAATCEALGFVPEHAPAYPMFGGERPLVVAVGGVDHLDAPLVNSRLGGQPALVALGANGIAAGEAESAAALTGTSVSTVVASSAAALAWSYRPELSPDALVDAVYTAGWATGEDASAGAYAGDPVRRVSICASLDAVCEGQAPEQCPALDCPATAPSADGDLGDYFMTVEQTLAGETVETVMLEDTRAAPSCDEHSYDILGQPQPEVPICPYCSVNVPPGGGTGTSTLYISIDAAYVGSITDALLISYDGARTPTTQVLGEAVVDSLNSSTSGVTAVVLPTTDVNLATITFTLDDPTGPLTQSNPVTVNLL